MSEIKKFNLPKVQLRIKTANLDAFQNIQTEGNYISFKDHSPSVFQERIKMKKQIQESYIRFRKHKKNNYIKQYSSSKRSHSDKRVTTIDLSKKTKNPENRVDLSLQTENNQKQLLLHKYSKQENVSQVVSKQRQSDTISRRDLLIGSCKSAQVQNSLLARHYSLYNTEIAKEIKQNLQLKGKQWKCYNQNESKRIYNHILKMNHQHIRNKNVSGKSSSFRIQAWKSDKLTQSKVYFECQQLEIGS